jgi:hypothetical protein
VTTPQAALRRQLREPVESKQSVRIGDFSLFESYQLLLLLRIHSSAHVDQPRGMMTARQRLVRYTFAGLVIFLSAAAVTALSQMQMVVAAVQPRPGYGVSAAGKEFRCPIGTFNTAVAGQRSCVSCPAGFTTLAEGTTTAACFVRPGW